MIQPFFNLFIYNFTYFNFKYLLFMIHYFSIMIINLINLNWMNLNLINLKLKQFLYFYLISFSVMATLLIRYFLIYQESHNIKTLIYLLQNYNPLVLFYYIIFQKMNLINYLKNIYCKITKVATNIFILYKLKENELG